MALISKTKTWVDAENVAYTDLNADFDNIYNEFNGNIDNSNIKSGAGIDPLKVAGGAVTLSTPQTISGKKTLIDPLLQAYDGWITTPDTYVYASANSVTNTSGVDETGIYTKGTRVKFTNNSTTFYGAVLSCTYVGGVNTITFINNSDFSIANSVITNPFYSYDANPQGWPTFFAFAVGAWTGFSVNPASVIKYTVTGNKMDFFVDTGVGTSNSSNFSFTIPVTAITDAFFMGTGFDNGGYVAGASPGYLAGNVVNVYKQSSQTGGWTTSGNKAWKGQFSCQF